jgi:hypothetical protein
MTWIGNALILIGMYLIGKKYRSAFLWSAAGETIWTCCATANGQYDLSFICGVFVIVALINYWRWGREEE